MTSVYLVQRLYVMLHTLYFIVFTFCCMPPGVAVEGEALHGILYTACPEALLSAKICYTFIPDTLYCIVLLYAACLQALQSRKILYIQDTLYGIRYTLYLGAFDQGIRSRCA